MEELSNFIEEVYKIQEDLISSRFNDRLMVIPPATPLEDLDEIVVLTGRLRPRNSHRYIENIEQIYGVKEDSIFIVPLERFEKLVGEENSEEKHKDQVIEYHKAIIPRYMINENGNTVSSTVKMKSGKVAMFLKDGTYFE